MSERYVIREGLERGKGQYWVGYWTTVRSIAIGDAYSLKDAVSEASEIQGRVRIVRLVRKRSASYERDWLLEGAREFALYAVSIPAYTTPTAARAMSWLAAYDKLRGAK